LRIDEKIFREYDIRGDVSKKSLSEELFVLLGKAVGTYFLRKGLKRIAVGHDNRKSSPAFHEALVKGIVSTGCTVLDMGMIPTPVLYYSIFRFRAGAGCMITGSHTPPNYNGLKISMGFTSLHGKEIQKIKEIVKSGEFRKGKGKIEIIDPIEDYIKMLRRKIKLKKSVKIVMDSGNGMAGLVVPRIIREIGADISVLYAELDGNFPNHQPDPSSPKNLNALIEEVKKTGAEAGIAFDGDADRMIAVDGRGNILLGDYLLALFFEDISKRRRIKKAVADIKCSQAVIDHIERLGGEVILCRTGHSIIEEEMKERHVMLAGEVSGHIFFRDRYYGFDDAIYASLRFLQLLSDSRKTLNELYDELPSYYTSMEYRLKCSDSEKFEIVESVKKDFETEYEIIGIDGVRVKFEDGWALVRASNTQPQLSVRFESKTKRGYNRIKQILVDELAKHHAVEENIE